MANEDEDISSQTDDTETGGDEGGQAETDTVTTGSVPDRRVVAVPGRQHEEAARKAAEVEPKNRQERRQAWMREREARVAAEKRAEQLDRQIGSLTDKVAQLTTTSREFITAQRRSVPGEADPRVAKLQSLRKEMNQTLAAMKNDPTLIEKFHDLQDQATDLRADMKVEQRMQAEKKNTPAAPTPEFMAVQRDFPEILANRNARDQLKININRLSEKYSDAEWSGNAKLRLQVIQEAAIKAANDFNLPIPAYMQRGAINGASRVAGTGSGSRTTSTTVMMPAPTEALLNIAMAAFPNARDENEAYQLWWNKTGKKIAEKTA